MRRWMDGIADTVTSLDTVWQSQWLIERGTCSCRRAGDGENEWLLPESEFPLANGSSWPVAAIDPELGPRRAGSYSAMACVKNCSPNSRSGSASLPALCCCWVLHVFLGAGESVTYVGKAEHRCNFPTEISGIRQSPADLQG